ncbi:distal tail protein Dit [Salicibibacter kimchii]|uniref:Siphovirus-type tail component C-terminal domain-containing protein n=1 Tax=Salicibibacter kimchii TaxID=2099786 RepID=A0A345BUJ6_9BACI|nr:distal tail protein Dit [Salicibibacter kimchii]AXF54627.1 hypothetical protein DT065_00430 [Salicibibacter kimchii]
MYNFVDPNERGERTAPLTSFQTVFNGTNIDDALTDDNGRFVTTSVSGRGFLTRRINMIEVPYGHGDKEGSYTYEPRPIRVNFLIEDRTSEGFRDRLERLNGMLLGSKKVLEFTDESAHFIATLESGELPDEDSNSLQGTLNFICSNPAKFKSESTHTITTTDTTVEVGGQEKTPWISRTVFEADQDEFEIEMNNGCHIIIPYNFISGDVLEIDYERRKITLNGENHMYISLQSHWMPLHPGYMQMRASHETELSYTERYY